MTKTEDAYNVDNKSKKTSKRRDKETKFHFKVARGSKDNKHKTRNVM